MQVRAQDLDAVWRALSNPVRRRILDELAEGAVDTGTLSERFPELSRFAIMQHLKVLEMGRLVIRRKSGRRVLNHVNPVPIQQIYDRWVKRYHRPWAETLVDLKLELEREAARHRPPRRKRG